MSQRLTGWLIGPAPTLTKAIFVPAGLAARHHEQGEGHAEAIRRSRRGCPCREQSARRARARGQSRGSSSRRGGRLSDSRSSACSRPFSGGGTPSGVAVTCRARAIRSGRAAAGGADAGDVRVRRVWRTKVSIASSEPSLPELPQPNRPNSAILSGCLRRDATALDRAPDGSRSSEAALVRCRAVGGRSIS